MNKMRDDHEFNIRFVEMIKNERCLYDKTMAEYRSAEEHERIWQRIALQTNESVNHCKERWRNLRACLTRHLKQQKKQHGTSTNSGTDGNFKAQHKPYYLAEHMKFLIPFTRSRSRESPNEEENSNWKTTTSIESSNTNNPKTTNIKQEEKHVDIHDVDEGDEILEEEDILEDQLDQIDETSIDTSLSKQSQKQQQQILQLTDQQQQQLLLAQQEQQLPATMTIYTQSEPQQQQQQPQQSTQQHKRTYMTPITVVHQDLIPISMATTCTPTSTVTLNSSNHNAATTSLMKRDISHLYNYDISDGKRVSVTNNVPVKFNNTAVIIDSPPSVKSQPSSPVAVPTVPITSPPKNSQNSIITKSTEEADLNFFKSLLPDMQQMTASQKRKFKSGIFQLIDNIFEHE